MVLFPRADGSLSSSQRTQLERFRTQISGQCAGVEEKKEDNCVCEFQLQHVYMTHLPLPSESLTPGCEVILLSPMKYGGYKDIKAGQYRYENKVRPTTAYLFGTNDQGKSLCVKTTGFMPYVYVELTNVKNVNHGSEMLRKELLGLLRLPDNALVAEVVVKHKAYGWMASPNRPSERRRFPFIKLKCINDNVRNLVVRHLKTSNHDVSEDKVSQSAQFMAELGLRASAWVRVTDYSVCPRTERQSFCAMELVAPLRKLEPFANDSIPPLLLLAFDIECNSNTGAFPDATLDEIIYIGLTFWRHGHASGEPIGRIMMVLGSCAAVPDTLVLCFESELEMIQAFRDIVVYYTDPDIVTGYNISGFDCAYLDNRLKTLCGVEDYQSTRFSFGSRLIGVHEPIYWYTKSSAAMGENEICEFVMTGRLVMDMYMWMKVNKKLTSYSLDFVSQLYVPQCTGKVKLVKPMWSVFCVDELLHGISQEPRYTQFPTVHLVVQQLQQKLEEGYAQWDDVRTCLSDETRRREADDLEEQLATSFGILINLLLHELNSLNDSLLSKKQLPLEPSEFVNNAFDKCLTACGDNNYKKLFAMYKLTDQDRATIAYYCAVDCDLTLYLMNKLAVVPDTVLMSRVTHTLLSDISSRGQQIKVYNQIYRFCQEHDFVMNMRDSGWDFGAEFQGATVLPPTPNYYEDPIATLDFASLYPSIMQAHNLCFSTVILDEPEKENSFISTSTYDIGSQRATFVNSETTKGILPSILQHLLSARKQAKKDMEAATDPFQQQIYNSRQLALKISANSMYGFTGVANNGMYSCLWVANTVTLTGRGMIEATKNFVEANYPGVQVVYGDTDSVMCRFHRSSPLLENVSTDAELMPRVFEVAEDMSKRASALFKAPNKLEFEKVYYPYLLIGKKNYVGMKYEGSPTKEPKMDAKGIEIVRRDKIAILRNTLKDILYLSLQQKDYGKAYTLLVELVNKFVTGSITVEDVVTSKSLKSQYKSDVQPQVQVVKKMTRRKAFGVPRVGDRVPFVIIEDNSEKNVSLRAEHPDYARRNKLTLDRLYYLELVEKPLLRVLQYLPMPSLERLFEQAKAELSRRILRIHDVTQFFTVSDRRAPVRQVSSSVSVPAVPAAPETMHALCDLGSGSVPISTVSRLSPKRKPEECKQSTLTGIAPAKKAKRSNKKKVASQGSLEKYFL